MPTERSGFEEESGKLTEYFLCGEILETPEYLKELKEVQKKNGFVSYKDSLRLARKYSPYDPVNSQKPFLNHLRMELIDSLDLETNEDMDRVKIYTAAGSPLDKWHGIFFFVEIENKNHLGSKIIGFDIKADRKAETEIKRNNLHDLKADVLVNNIPDSKAHEEEYYGRLREIAMESVAALKAKENKSSA